MSGTKAWSGGYVADVGYIEGFYAQQAPARTVLACLLGNVAIDLPASDDPVHYLEPGCGRGMGALMIAASNPAWHVTAIDYNPSHIAEGTAMARAAGIGNIRFMEADLATLADSPAANAIPQADFVSMHGVWTWVSPDVRAGIVRLLADKVRPGGAVHVSYNAMPAWQGALGMQRLVSQAGSRTASRSDRQASAGLQLVRDLKEAGAVYLRESNMVGALVDAIDTLRPEYLSHEYMNTYWAPAYHADVATDLARAKLDWVASANPLENFPELMLTEQQRAVVGRYDDPLMRELIKDTCLPRQFRHDVFVRGARPLDNVERERALRSLTLAPLVVASELTANIDVPAGKAEMSDALKLMMTALMEGTFTVDELLAHAPGKSTPSELVSVLVGSMQGQIVVRPGVEQPAAATRLNALLGGRVHTLMGPAGSSALASGRLGTGFLAPRLIQFIAARLLAGEREDAAPRWIETLSADVAHDDREKLAKLVELAVIQRVPVLRRLGIVPE